MREGTESTADQRLDHAAVVDFLTSTASALCDHGIVSSKDTDNLRLALSGIASGSEPLERSLLVELEVQHADFLALLTVRFGTVGLCLNLLRHTLRPPLVDTQRMLLTLGQALIKKAELMFNRPFRLFRGAQCLRQTLFSTVIIDFAESLEQSCQLLGDALSELALMNPNDLAGATAEDYALDEAIAQALGFSGLLRPSLPVQNETASKHKIAQALERVAQAATLLSEQLAANTGEELAHDVLAACEGLRAEGQRLNLLEFPRGDSLLVWEVRRRHLIGCVQALNAALAEVARTSLAAIAPEALQASTALPEAVKRRLVFDLISSGVAPAKASEAVHDLLTFLAANKVTPHTLLPAELSRIHPQLLLKTLESLKTLSDDASLMTLAGREKSSTMARSQRLGQSFQQTAASMAGMALALALALLFTACGLKTKPTSSIQELRPDIPFRIAAPSKPVDAGKPEKDTSGATQPAPGGSFNDRSPQTQP